MKPGSVSIGRRVDTNARRPSTEVGRSGIGLIRQPYLRVQGIVLAVLANPLLQVPVVLLLLVPLIATIGQYVHTGFILKWTPVSLLFWPGVDGEVALSMPVWVAIGAMLTAYAAGIVYLARRRNLGKAALLGLTSALVATGLAGIINSLTGWQEHQTIGDMDLAGKANSAIFSLWHNPIWEEIVFRGFPFIVLLAVLRHTKSQKAALWARACYFVIPALAFSLYHLPNHGASRLIDTFILGLAFAWMTLRFSFFAPLVLHCIFDAMMIPNLGDHADVLPEEITWITSHQNLLNNMSSVATISLVALIPLLLTWYWRRHRSPRATGQYVDSQSRGDLVQIDVRQEGVE
ncbi:MAG: CPBP family intramembrane metalloprotease [Dehalococcoidia bacterium]|nr:CPBP family intramembrane metalloprotease [Dehalococcoidia bacterium]